MSARRYGPSERAPLERLRPARHCARWRAPALRDEPDHRSARFRQDNLGPAVRLPQRDRRRDPALYLSTVSEPLDKILRYGQSLDFFDTSAVGSRVIYDDLGQALNDGGLTGVLTQLTALLREHRPGLLVIDSFKALRAYAAEAGEIRRFLHNLAGQLSAMAVSAFWIGEYDAAEAADAPECAVADSIISLRAQRSAEQEVRVLQVMKLRGSGFISGQHAYRLSPQGLTVYPRMADNVSVDAYDLVFDRTTSGVPLLDGMLSDGYWEGTSTLVVGPPGRARPYSHSILPSPSAPVRSACSLPSRRTRSS